MDSLLEIITNVVVKDVTAFRVDHRAMFIRSKLLEINSMTVSKRQHQNCIKSKLNILHTIKAVSILFIYPTHVLVYYLIQSV